MSPFRVLALTAIAILLVDCSDSNSPEIPSFDPVLLTQDPEPVVFTDLPPDSLHYAPWSLIEASIEGDILNLHVGFSGCQPDHPWTFHISGGFMESWPVQVNGVLVHELYEDCEAYFETWLHFNLLPLKIEYIRIYGQDELIILNVIDFQGEVHPLEYRIDTLTAVPDRH